MCPAKLSLTISARINLLSARKLRNTLSVNPSLEFCITEPALTTAPGSRNADSILSALPYATREFLSHAEEKILQAGYVTAVPNCIPAS
jgi:hypothetical protein